MSFNQELNTSIAFAKYPPFNLDIFGSLIFQIPLQQYEKSTSNITLLLI